MKILYVDDDEDLKALVSIKLEATLDFEVIDVNSGNSAIRFLETNKEPIDLIISDFNMPDGNGNVIYEYVKDKIKNKIPFFFCTTRDTSIHDSFKTFLEDNPKNLFIKKPYHYKHVFEGLQKVFELKEIKQLPRYCKIKINYLKNFGIAASDIYVKLSDKKFVKILNEGHEFDDNFMNNYLSKGMDYLYIAGKNFKNFNEKFVEILSKKMDKELTTQDRYNLEVTGVSYVQDNFKILGIDKNIINCVETITKSSIKRLQSTNKNIFTMLEKMMTSDDYLSNHSLLISNIAGAISIHMHGNDNLLLEKLTTASLLHDIVLNKIDENLVQMHDYMDHNDYAAETQYEVIEKIFVHTMEAATLLTDSKTFSPDVIKIILNHHERPDGTGYPNKKNCDDIPPLSCLFIIVEDFVKRIFSKKLDQEMIDGIKDDFMKVYNKGNFIDPLEGMIKFLEDGH